MSITFRKLEVIDDFKYSSYKGMSYTGKPIILKSGDLNADGNYPVWSKRIKDTGQQEIDKGLTLLKENKGLRFRRKVTYETGDRHFFFFIFIRGYNNDQ